MRFLYWVYLFFLFFPFLLQSQEIQGHVIDFDSQLPISKAFVKIKLSATDTKILLYTTTNREGYYHIDLSTKEISNEVVYLEISKLGYATDVVTRSIEHKSTYTQDFYLSSETINLDAVEVQGTYKPIRHKKDTIIYQATSFRTGEEQTVEDLLKKLPGFDIDKNSGVIRVQNVPIKKILIEGEDIMGSQYTVGSKNLSADIIKEVEAINNWNENQLLQGIEETGDIVLNLKLKKQALRVSGSAEIGIGIKQKARLNITDLLMFSKFKSFGVLSMNNLGENKSPYQYLSNTHVVESGESSLRNVIESNTDFTGFDASRISSNHITFASLNNQVDLKEYGKLKLFANYLKDDVSLKRKSQTIFYNHSKPIYRDVGENISKTPDIKNLTFEWELLDKDKSRWLVKSNGLDKRMIDKKTTWINSQKPFTQELRDRTYYSISEIEYTRKTSEDKAITLNLYANFSKLPQSIYFSENQSLFPDLRENLNENVFQKVTIQNNELKLSSSYFSSVNQNPLHIESEFYRNNSRLYSINNLKHQINNLKYNQYAALFRVTYAPTIFKYWQIKPRLGIQYHTSHLQDGILNIDKNKVILSPNLFVQRLFKNHDQIYFQINYNERPQDLIHLYSKKIISSPDLITQNQANLNFQKTFFINFKYNKKPVFKQFQSFLSLFYMSSTNQFTPHHFIQKDYSLRHYILTSKQMNSINIESMAEKFIPTILSTVTFKLKYSYTSFFNLTNNSPIQKNNSHVWKPTFSISTVFDFPLNLTSSINYSYAQFSSAVANKKSIQRLNTVSEIRVTPSNAWNIVLSHEYINSNLKEQSDLSFIDVMVLYKPKKSKWAFKLEGINLLNKNEFTRFNITDYFSTMTTHTLNRRYIIGSVKFLF